jgi:hypothetical protein
MSTTATKSNEQLVADMQGPANLFALDISAMPEEMLGACPGGKARCAYDLIYEVTEFNNYVAERVSGREGNLESDGWVRAPESFRSKDAALEQFKASMAALSSALLAVDAEALEAIAPSPFGELPLSRFAGIAPRHMMYHSGQLNYIQTIYGDDAFHWAE